MNNLKSIFICIIILILVFGSGFFLGSNYDNSNKIKTQVKEIRITRQTYILDTIVKERTKIKENYNTDTLYVKDLYRNGSDSSKIALFDSTYPRVDTNWLMRITSGQAEAAVLKAKEQKKDNALLVVEEKNSKNTDDALNKTNDVIDIIKCKEDAITSKGILVGIGSTSLSLLTIFGIYSLVP